MRRVGLRRARRVGLRRASAGEAPACAASVGSTTSRPSSRRMPPGSRRRTMPERRGPPSSRSARVRVSTAARYSIVRAAVCTAAISRSTPSGPSRPRALATAGWRSALIRSVLRRVWPCRASRTASSSSPARTSSGRPAGRGQPATAASQPTACRSRRPPTSCLRSGASTQPARSTRRCRSAVTSSSRRASRRPSRSSQRRRRPVISSISPTGPATSRASSSEVAASRSPLARSIASLGEQTAWPTWKPASHSG